jgi:hypothetical protein
VGTPGAQISLVIRDAVGNVVGSQTVFADLAGNWMVSFGGVTLYDESYSVEVMQTPAMWGGGGLADDQTTRFISIFNGSILPAPFIREHLLPGQIVGQILTPLTLEQAIADLVNGRNPGISSFGSAGLGAGGNLPYFVGNPAEAPGGAQAGAGMEAPAGIAVTVTVADDPRPGSMYSGVVTFPSGAAEWYLAPDGKIGLDPEVEGFKPSEAEMQEFLKALEKVRKEKGF